MQTRKYLHPNKVLANDDVEGFVYDMIEVMTRDADRLLSHIHDLANLNFFQGDDRHYEEIMQDIVEGILADWIAIVDLEDTMTAARPKHKWSNPLRRAAPGGCDYTERECYRCGMLKRTMHPPRGLIWTEFLTDLGVRIAGDKTPTCGGYP